MRNLAVFGAAGAEGTAVAAEFPAVEIDEMTVRSGIVHTDEPAFDPRGAHARQVLVRVSAFSCNYRDKAFMLRLQKQAPEAFFVIGSEFCATVEAVGAEVESLSPGDRVIGQNHYTGGVVGPDGVAEGVATNRASKEYQLFPEAKVARIPDRMGDEVGAAFSIGAQTAYNMVRRVAPRPGEKVLVTSAASNTSLFALAALRGTGAEVYAATTSRALDDRLRAAGADHLVHVGGDGEPFGRSEAVDRAAGEAGGFDCVIDPYFDLHLEKAVTVMAPFGRYTTCGVLAQSPVAARKANLGRMNAENVLLTAMLRNLSLIGNCIGTRDDLARALDDYAAGRLACVVDSVFSGGDTAAFLHRTYVDRARFGKVVFRYT